MAGSGMEVDPPTTSSVSVAAGPPLKRSNSAPMINLLSSCPRSPVQRHHHEHDGHCSTNATSTGETCTTTAALCNHASHASSLFKSGETSRIRRFSASYSVGLHSPTAALKTPYRLDQLKHEERVHNAEREVAHEREFQSAVQMSMSWDDLTLQDEVMPPTVKRPAPSSEPLPLLHIFTSPYPISSSPSPTRIGKQCFSPSLQAPVKASAIAPGKTPSPTRKVARRSGSPITLRQSPLSIKRKLASGDFDDAEAYYTPPKRFHPIQATSTPDRLPAVVTHSLIHCISSSSPSESSSPEQQVPSMPLTSNAVSPARSLGSMPSAFTFRPVQPAENAHTPVSQHMSEATEMTVSNSEENTMAMERDVSHSGMISVSMDASPSNAFNTSTGRPTQV